MKDVKKNKRIIFLSIISIIIVMLVVVCLICNEIISNHNAIPNAQEDYLNNETTTKNENNTTKEENSGNTTIEEDTVDTKNDSIIGEPISGIEIKNEEIKTLYSYTQSSLNSNYVCLGYFYQNPFSNHDLNDKISLVLINYGYNYLKKIDAEFIKKIIGTEKEKAFINDHNYIEANIIKEGMKLIFNINIDNFEDGAQFGRYTYRSDVDAFIDSDGGGDYDAQIVQQIIDYNELSEEITLTVVKAEIGYDNNVYRYVNKKDTLAYENMSRDKFKFTNENLDRFPQIKYIFKKNEIGNYYVNDIVNLNYEEDYARCN